MDDGKDQLEVFPGLEVCEKRGKERKKMEKGEKGGTRREK
jgi:hypothetical protein